MTPPSDRTGRTRTRELPIAKKVLFAAVVVIAILAAIEGVLALAGIQPGTGSKDPFVGFAGNIPLFVEEAGPDGRTVLVTAANKRSVFNAQSFPKAKAPGTIRIFTLGGSTTYGHPYDDRTSFSRWLRELLAVADPSHRYEVVNAGGISYASYRVAGVLDELARYEPDVFIVYTGHNEFLEERSYGKLRRIPAPVRATMGLLARTRIWTAMGTVVRPLAPARPKTPGGRAVLPAEVQARLDHSAGPADYERDDALAAAVVEHLGFTLERMVGRAREAGARVIFVTPAANLKDCSPFRSDPTPGISKEQEGAIEPLLAAAKQSLGAGSGLLDSGDPMEAGVDLGSPPTGLDHGPPESGADPTAPLGAAAALNRIDAVIAVDPRRAELHYWRGRALLALGRNEEAEIAFVRARDEDVCPLRAPSPVIHAIREAARRTGSRLVDFEAEIRQLSEERTGSPAPGEEIFLDHVHPTIEGHRRLALSIIDAMADEGMIRPAASWDAAAVESVVERVEAGFDPNLHAQALANLAMTLDWAGKKEESRRLVLRSLEDGTEDPTVYLMAARHLASDGDGDAARSYLRRAVILNPNNPVTHSQYGLLLTGTGLLEEATAHFFMACLLWPENEVYHQQLGSVLVRRGRLEAALGAYWKAQSLNPAKEGIAQPIAWLKEQLGDAAVERAAIEPELEVTRHPSGYPSTVGQLRPDASGRAVRDGLWTEWHDGGALKRLVDYSHGRTDGASVAWDADGSIVERSGVTRFEGAIPGHEAMGHP